MTITSISLVLLIAFMAGMDGILDEWQFHQPLVVAPLIGLVLGDIQTGIILGGTLQMIMIGWMNIGAAIAPDIALPSVITAILTCGPADLTIKQGIVLAIPIAIIGQWLTIMVRKIVSKRIHKADLAAERGDLNAVSHIHLNSLFIQGLRVLIPVGGLLLIKPELIYRWINQLPSIITNGIEVSVGLIVAVGFAIIIHMLADKSVWPWFFIGFGLSIIVKFNIILMTVLGICLIIIYLKVNDHEARQRENNSEPDDLDKELDDL